MIMEVVDLWEQTEMFVIDIDGTFRHGQTLAPNAMEFIDYLKKHKKRFMFFTNNSSQSPNQYRKELNQIGCQLEPEQVMSLSKVTSTTVALFQSSETTLIPFFRR